MTRRSIGAHSPRQADGTPSRGTFGSLSGSSEFAASVMRRAMAVFLASGGRPADGLVIGLHPAPATTG